MPKGCCVAGTQQKSIQHSFQPSARWDERHQQDPQASKARKRAYRKACNNAATHGVTHYRGHIHTLQSLGQPHWQVHEPPRHTHWPIASIPKSPLLVFGMEFGIAEVYRDIDLMRFACGSVRLLWTSWSWWRLTGPHRGSDGTWHYVSVATHQETHGGILVMIRARVCAPRDIAHCSICPGRVIHVSTEQSCWYCQH